MTIIDSIRKSVVPIHPEGHPFIALFALASVILGWFIAPLFWIGLFLTLWCTYFFSRSCARDPPSAKVGDFTRRRHRIGCWARFAAQRTGFVRRAMMRVSVFMNVFNVHVNRAPLPGKVRRVAYKPGKFVNAELDKASEHNERNSLILDTEYGAVGVTQIAGLVARRIVCWAQDGEELPVGERFGLIRFGSRVDVYLPTNIVPCVVVGQTMIAGETILANMEGEQGESRAHREQ